MTDRTNPQPDPNEDAETELDIELIKDLDVPDEETPHLGGGSCSQTRGASIVTH